MKHSVEEVVLNNGTRGLLIHVPGASVMSFDFEFRAGHQYVPDKKIFETPHIMEHMVLGANAQFPDARKFNAELEKNGAYSNASTSTVSLKYVADCADFEWDRILNLLKLAITEPLFLPGEFKAEFGNVKEELTGYLNNHNRILWQRIGQASGEDYLNDDERLKVISNVRLKDIKEHYERTHTAENLRFIIAGNLKGDRVEKITAMLESWKLPKGERLAKQHDELVGTLEPIHIQRKDVENMIFGLSIQANWNFSDSERDAMRALNHMLTGTLHSKILGRARSLGLAYGMWSDFVVEDNSSEWDFGGQVSLNNAPKLLKIVKEEILKARDGKITVADLQSAKQFSLGKHQMGCQTVGSIASWYSSRYFMDGYVDDYAKRPQAIEAITKQTITSAVDGLLSGKRWAFGGLGQCSSKQLSELHEQLSELFK